MDYSAGTMRSALVGNTQSIIIEKSYIGVIKEGVSKELDGKYLVHIRELMGLDGALKPIWVKNEVLGNRFSRWLDLESKDTKSSGSYFPLQPGMMVNVRFRGYTMESGYISNVVSYLPLVDKPGARDTFYLLNKTVKNSWIYQDDARNLTHIMQSGGKSNITLDDNGITLQTGGKVKTNGFEVSKTGTRFEFGNASISLDSSGITFKVGDTTLTMSETGINVNTQGALDIESGKMARIKARRLELGASEEMTLHSNVLRVTGSTQCSLASNVVNINSVIHTNIESQAQVNIAGLMKTKIAAPVLDITSLTNINIAGPVITLSGQNTNIDGTAALNISSASIAMDGMLSHGLGLATSTNTSMAATNLALGLSTDAANIALVTGLGLSNPVSAIVNSTMVQAIPGSCAPVGEILKPVITSAKVGSSTTEKLQYIASSNDSYNIALKDQFDGLRNTHEIRV
jgi:hypothetical protein